MYPINLDPDPDPVGNITFAYRQKLKIKDVVVTRPRLGPVVSVRTKKKPKPVLSHIESKALILFWCSRLKSQPGYECLLFRKPHHWYRFIALPVFRTPKPLHLGKKLFII